MINMTHTKSVKKILFISIIVIVTTGFIAGIGIWHLASIEIQSKKPIVITTSTMLEYFAKEIGKDKIEVYTPVPAGVCPQLYEPKPSDITMISHATLIIHHGIEIWLADLIEASGNTNLKKSIRLGCPRYWLPVNKERVDWIRDAIIEIKPEESDFFTYNAELLWNNITETMYVLKERAKEYNVSQYKTISIECQRLFLDWLGFEVVDIFPPPIVMSVKDKEMIINTAKKEAVSIVLSNVQGGTDFGECLASEIGAKHVVVTNLPYALPGTDTYMETLEYNAQQLFDACGR